MKRTTGIKNWLAAALVVGIAWSHSQPLWAQENNSATNIAPIAAEATDRSMATTSAATNDTSNEAVVAKTSATGENQSAQRRRGPVVKIGGDATANEGESAEVVVAIGGSATAGGNVKDAVVAIGGNALAKGDVGDAVVAIAGNAEANGKVGDAVVAVLGNVKIGPGAVVHGDAVAVGGKVEIAEGGKVEGEVVEVGVGKFPMLAPFMGLGDWFKHCVLKLRLLAPQVRWVWGATGAFLLLYLLITVALPRPIAACVNELTQRPATTFMLGLLTLLLLPLVALVLTMTGIGVFVVPFVFAVVAIAALIGKAALLQYFGGLIFRAFGNTVARPVPALLTGFALITLLYLVPILSLLVFAMTCLWAIGVAVTAAFGGARKESPKRPDAPPASPTATSTTEIAPVPVANLNPSAATDCSLGAATANQPTMPSQPMVTAVSEALSLPPASFWERMGAAFLDVILVSILGSFVGGPPLGFLVALAYFAGMWAWKGTTIGGVILKLKVVRLDDQPITFAVALVRGLASAFSVIVLFLGFFWMIWDRDKQTWHDKIAGTVVVRLPRSMSLLCL
jgi:uncharacterized RDD family membrane protein YckC